jgi:hypothetical protein
VNTGAEVPTEPGGATQATPGITCVLAMGVFFATAWGLQTLFRRIGSGPSESR